MSQKIPTRIENLLEKLIDSIPPNFDELLSSDEKEELNQLLDLMGISSNSINIIRTLSALLLLNRIRFIIQTENRETDLHLSMNTMNSNLEQQNPKTFISSILSVIANQSNFVVTTELFSYISDFKTYSKELFSTLYENSLKQKHRRKLGQFWTPPEISEFMVDLILEKNPRNILDPCCGPGTFLHTLKQIAPNNYKGKTSGVEIHPLLFEIASVNSFSSIAKVEIIYGNFLTISPENYQNSINDSMGLFITRDLNSYIGKKKIHGFDAVICNPPYSRHHLLQPIIKKKVGLEIENTFGGKFSRISSLFVYFVLKSMKYLAKKGRMVFITPSIAFESRNSIYLKRILKQNFTIPYIIIFHQSLNIFSGVDTAACIFVVDGKKPSTNSVTRLIVIKNWTSKEDIISNALKSHKSEVEWKNGDIYCKKQSDLDPERNWTSTRFFSQKKKNDKLIELSQFFKVMRGIATGNNNFFTFTEEELTKYQIKKEYVVPTITKTRYIQKYLLSVEDFINMKKEGRKIWLLDIREEFKDIKDKKLLKYLQLGLDSKVHTGSLVQTRKKWFSTERREVPIFICTYLSRGNPRFIFNKAKIRPLNTFLMLYPKTHTRISKEELSLFWLILNSSSTKDSLQEVGRSYGGDTIKVEPKEMMKLQIVDPYKLTISAKEKLNKLVGELKLIEHVSSTVKKDLFNQIDRILEKEINS